MHHKAYLRGGKRGYSRRLVNEREIRQRFLIVCEGEKTEPNYFRKFRNPTVVIDVRGTGFNTVKLIEEAVTRKSKDNYDQVWCVFDRDSFPSAHINEAIQLARKHSIQIAYSNEAFELWYLLHFQYLENGLTRQDYISRLSELLQHPYEKNSETIYEELLHSQNVALRNARRLHQIYGQYNPITCNPSTTVYLLVEELNRFGSK